MAAIESEIYFRVRFWWWQSFGKTEIYWHTKFRWHISIHGSDKTTSGFGKRMAAILELYFRFLFLPNFRHRRVILHWPTKLRQNQTTLGGVMTSYRFFSRWRPAAILDLIWIILDHSRSAVGGWSSNLVLTGFIFSEILRFLTRCMESGCGLAMRKLSVCLSVHPSVKRVNWGKTEERPLQIFIPYERSFSLVFWEEEWLVVDDPFYLKFWVNPFPSKIAPRLKEVCYKVSLCESGKVVRHSLA